MADDARPSHGENDGPTAAVGANVAERQAESVEGLRAELNEQRDQNLRLMAELRNVQQRAQRDKQESLRYAEGDFARELLPIVDDLERTVESARQSPDPAALAEGVRIIYEHLLKVMRSRGIEPIPALGKAFDPHVHQAVAQQPSSEHAVGTVIGEVARGYRMHDRVLRPSQVIVASGPDERAG